MDRSTRRHHPGLRREGTEAIMLPACVQMPPLPAVQRVEDELRLPLVTAVTVTTVGVLCALGHQPAMPGASASLPG